MCVPAGIALIQDGEKNMKRLVDELNGATVFSKLDLNQVYHQFELEPKSRNLTTFSTRVGLYRFKRPNYGTVSAQE